MFSRVFPSVTYGISLKSNFSTQKITCQRALYLGCINIKRDLTFHRSQDDHFRTSPFSVTLIRHISGSTTKNASINNLMQTSIDSRTDSSLMKDLISNVPEPPSAIASEIVEVLVEPSFKSLGIGNWYPPGILQQWLEFLHVTAGLPWWGSIMCTTICIRLLMFPLVIHLQRYTAKMQNLVPELTYLQNQISEARKRKDELAALEASNKLHMFMKLNDMSSFKNVGLPIVQTPIFISVLWGLKGMIRLPVESMKSGGLWWFQDLTIQDPLYILPILTSATLFLTIVMSTSNMRLKHLRIVKYAFRITPIILFPLLLRFETAILCYWVTSNTFSVIQTLFLRIPKVKKYFGILKLKEHVKESIEKDRKSFIEEFKDSLSNLKVARELQLRQIYHESVALKAGRGPASKVYKHNRLKVVPSPVLSKRRDQC